MDRNERVHKNLLELIGQTPMIQLNNITKKFPGKYFAKLEMFNPGQSQKDRIALHIVENAEKKGILKPGSTIVETTSGNTGFSLAMIAMVKGYQCKLAVSDKSSTDKSVVEKQTVFKTPENIKVDTAEDQTNQKDCISGICRYSLHSQNSLDSLNGTSMGLEVGTKI